MVISPPPHHTHHGPLPTPPRKPRRPCPPLPCPPRASRHQAFPARLRYVFAIIHYSTLLTSFSEHVIDSVVDTVDYAMGRPSSSRRGRALSRRSEHASFATFVTNVLTRAEVTIPTILVSLVYIDRAKPHLQIALEEWACERVFLGAVMVASKVHCLSFPSHVTRSSPCLIPSISTIQLSKMSTGRSARACSASVMLAALSASS